MCNTIFFYLLSFCRKPMGDADLCKKHFSNFPRSASFSDMPRRKSAQETAANGRMPVTIGLTPRANRIVNEWCDRTGGSKAKMIERLVEWFAAAPSSIQQFIVVGPPDDMRREFIEKAVAYFEGVTIAPVEGADRASASGGRISATKK